MSRTKTIPKLPAEARPLQQQLRAWRAQRRPGMPIPEELWARAVALAGKHGVGSLARGLPLDHGALKKRVERAVSAAPRSPAFIELPSMEPLEIRGSRDAVVEITRPDGARLLIRLPRQEQLDVAGLAASFFGGTQ